MARKSGIRNYNELKKQIQGIGKVPEKAMKKMIGDAKKQVKGWVAAEITKEYGVDAAQEIKTKSIGTVRVKNAKENRLDRLQFVYSGRPLTPTHFSMTPTRPHPDGYSLKTTVIRGQQKTLGEVKKLTPKQRARLAKNFNGKGWQWSKKSPIMLMPVTDTKYIPFQRVSKDRKDIEAIKTVSLPQMVSSKRASENISTVVNNGISERMYYYMKKYMDK